MASDLPGTPASGDTKDQVFFGRFISTPTKDELQITEGAILVSGGKEGGVILTSAWGIKKLKQALKALGVEEEEVEIYQTGEQGFFFPGFIGKWLTMMLVGFVLQESL